MNWYRNLPNKHRETIVSYIFLAPALLFFIGFVVFPISSGIVTSFFDYSTKNFEFIGLGNYIELMTDEIFTKSVVNTIVLVFMSVPIIVIFSLFVSLVIYEKNAILRSAFRGAFYLPVVTGTVAITVVWKWIFDKYNGVLNYMLGEEIAWLADPTFALWAIAIILITTSVGQPIILYVAALGNLDKSHIESAQIDGANAVQVFRHIKWPGIMPTTLYVVVISTINTFQCFALIQLLTSGGPNYATSTIMYLIYETAFDGANRFGYANAMGLILTIVIGIFSLIQFKVFGNNPEN